VQRKRVPRIPDTLPPLYDPPTVRAWLLKKDLGNESSKAARLVLS
jgi:hypothetical protein